MIIHKVLFTIFLFVTTALVEEVYDPCSKFLGHDGHPLVKCPSEKSDDDYLECYDKLYKEYMETDETQISFFTKNNWCWSRHDNSDAFLKNVTISTGFYDNSDFNDKINRPFTTKFYDNGTHMICIEDDRWLRPILDGEHHYWCPTSTGIPMAGFVFSRQSKL